jgi:hypothetical protein
MPLRDPSGKLRRQVVGGVLEVDGEVTQVPDGASELNYVVVHGVGGAAASLVPGFLLLVLLHRLVTVLLLLLLPRGHAQLAHHNAYVHPR